MTYWNAVLLALVTSAVAHAQADAGEFFEKRVRPLLAEKCYACHTQSALGGLRLDSREALLEGGKNGPAVVEGNAADSLLIRAVRHADANLKMPMVGDKLSDQEIADLSHWVDAGAPWPDTRLMSEKAGDNGFRITPEQRRFWSFQPLRQPPLPAVRNAAWAKGPIDRFILAGLEEKGLEPNEAASRRVLIRRATYDLIGLPPTPEQVDAFLADDSSEAFAKVVDRLLASQHYGERWGRHWLDVARYADGDGPDRRPVFIGYGMAKDGFANTHRYRDWVVEALNRDLPYDLFVKAQIAADLLPGDNKELLPGLGFFGLGPWFTGDDVVFIEARADERDDKIDALTKGFLGLTVTCARCHDHKYDPISQKDYYALGGIFWSSGYAEYNLAPEDQVARYKEHWRRNKEQQATISKFMKDNALHVGEEFAAKNADYMMAVRRILTSSSKLDLSKVAAEEGLDEESLRRWVKYQEAPEQRQHPYFKQWDALLARGGGSNEEAAVIAQDLTEFLLAVIREKKEADAVNEELRANYKPEPNEARVSLPGDLMQFELFQFKQSLVQKVIETNKFYFFQELVDGDSGSINIPNVLAMYEHKDEALLRHLNPEKKVQLESMQSALKKMSEAAPPEYPYLMGIADIPEPQNLKLALRGNPHSLGDEVPRGLPAVLAHAEGEPLPLTNGSGRLELAEFIVRHPLAARVMVNRIWMHHFGRGIVASPSNFGMTGDRPTHPDLLEYLAGQFIENGWSMKALHREIVLSAAYQMSSQYVEANQTFDPDNKLLWRANVRRLDAEEIRDSLLFAAGILDERIGGPPQDLSSAETKKRAMYGRVRRRGADRMLMLFDFPDPSISGEQRNITTTPLQSLFFMNSDLVWRQAHQLAERVAPVEDGEADAAKIQTAYRLLYGRLPKEAEVRQGLQFLEAARASSPEGVSAWDRYAHVLLSSNEFYYVN